MPVMIRGQIWGRTRPLSTHTKNTDTIILTVHADRTWSSARNSSWSGCLYRGRRSYPPQGHSLEFSDRPELTRSSQLRAPSHCWRMKAAHDYLTSKKKSYRHDMPSRGLGAPQWFTSCWSSTAGLLKKETSHVCLSKVALQKLDPHCLPTFHGTTPAASRLASPLNKENPHERSRRLRAGETLLS